MHSRTWAFFALITWAAHADLVSYAPPSPLTCTSRSFRHRASWPLTRCLHALFTLGDALLSRILANIPKSTKQQTAAVAASERTIDPENQKYHVLMIVTDGVINDMGNTMDALVAAADLPFSVIMWVTSH